MTEESKLGYWHFEYEVAQYFSTIIVGQGVRTKGWGIKEYAERWSNYDTEGFNIWIEKEWSNAFKEGVINAYKDFKMAILEYNIGIGEKHYGYLRV